MVHWTSNYRTMGWCCIISANVTKNQMKTSAKTRATWKKHNNQASFASCSSILKANKEVEAAIELAPRPGRNWYALGAFASCWIARFLLGLLELV
jgi:hypothetical protein